MAQVFVALIVVTLLISLADACKKALTRLKDRREHAKNDTPRALLQ